MRYSEALEQQVYWHRYYVTYGGEIFTNWARERFSDKDVIKWSIIGKSPELWRSELINSLKDGDPYYWGSNTCELVETSAHSIPDWTLFSKDLPSESGFFWYSRPIPIITKYRIPQLIKNWLPDMEDIVDEPGSHPGYLRAISWHTPRNDCGIIRIYSHYTISESKRKTLIPGFGVEWSVGKSYLETYEDRYDNPIEEFCMRVFAASVAFISQRILVTPKQRAERHAAKRLERDGWTREPLVRVVELRRRASQNYGSDDPRTVAWSHQWMVAGHWRQQPYPSRSIVQPKWIAPYVKGPDDRPLKPPRAKVFAVVR